MSQDNNIKLSRNARLFLIIFESVFFALLFLSVPFGGYGPVAVLMYPNFLGAIVLFPPCIVLPPLYFRRACQQGERWYLVRYWLVAELLTAGLLAAAALSFFGLFSSFGMAGYVVGVYLGAPILLLDALFLQGSALAAYFRHKRQDARPPAPEI